MNTRTTSSVRSRRTRYVSATTAALAGAVVLTAGLLAQSAFPAYDRSDEGEIWEYVGTIGRSVDHCFATSADRSAHNFNADNCNGAPGDGDLFEPTGLATYGSIADGTYRLYVADRQNHRVVVYGSATSLQGYPYGNYIDTLAGWDSSGNHLTTSPGGTHSFGLIESVAVDASGNLLVADATKSRVVVFNSNLQYLFELQLQDTAYSGYLALTPGATIQAPSGSGPGISDKIITSPTNNDARCSSGTTSGRIALTTFNNSSIPATTPDDMNVVIIYDERFCELTRIGTASSDPANDVNASFGGLTGVAFERVSPPTVGQDARATGFGRLYVADYGSSASDGDSDLFAYVPTNSTATTYPAASANAGRLVDGINYLRNVIIDQQNRVVLTEPDQQKMVVFTRTWTDTNADGLADTVAYGSAPDFEIRAAGQIQGYPNTVVEDSSGRLLVTAGAGGSIATGDVVHVLEQPSLAVFGASGTVLDSGNLFLRRVHVEFKIATPARQSVSRTNVIPRATAVSAGLAYQSGPAAVNTVNGTTYNFPATGPAAPLNIDPGKYAVYAFEFDITDDSLGSVPGTQVMIDVDATSDGSVNAPKKTVSVTIPDSNCADTIAPVVTATMVGSTPVTGNVQGNTTQIYGKTAAIRLHATDTGGSTQMNLKWKFTDGPRSGGSTWTSTGFQTTTDTTTDVAVWDSSVQTSANHTLSWEAIDSCAKSTTGSISLFVDVLPPNVIFENVLPTSSGTYPGGLVPGDSAQPWWKSTVTVNVRGSDDDTSSANATISSTSPSFSFVAGRQDAGVLTFSGEGENSALVKAVDLVGNAYEKYSHEAQTVGFIRIDKTAPAVTIAPATQANAHGWYKNDVVFNITAEDANTRSSQIVHDLSGLKTITSAVSGGTDGSASVSLPVMTRAASPNTRHIATAVTTLSGEGRDFQVSASAEDYATNVTPSVAAAALVNIDKTVPTAAADKATGLYQQSVSVTLTAADALSGINRIEYSTDGVNYSSVLAGSTTLPPLTSTTTFRFRAVDNADNVSAETTYTYTINHAPSIVAHALTTNEDTAVSIDLLTGATDADAGQTLTVTSVDSAANGTLSLNGSTATFTPAANYFGTGASFTYTVSDGNGGTATATVTIAVASVNDLPNAVNDAMTIDEDAAATAISVLANDTDVETDPLIITGFTQGSKGVVASGTGGTLTYTPNANLVGTESFTYTVRDADGATDTATVTVTIRPVNDAPIARDDIATVAEDSLNTVINVLGGDSDVDGDTLTVQGVTQGAHGAVTLSGGTVTYTPAANYFGPDAFAYTINDGHGATATATVRVTVTPVPDAPVANDDSAQLGPNSSMLIDVLANDYDVDGDPLSLIGGVPPAHGTAVPETAGGRVQIRYTPSGAFVGTDAFQYTISDPGGLRATATVSVLVNTPPDCSLAAASIPFLWPPNHTRVDHVFVNGVTDPNGDPITITITGIRQDEPVDSTGDGEFTPDGAGVGDSSVWLRAERQGGTESNGRVYHVAFSASDGRGGVCTGTVKSIVPHDMGNPPTYVDDGPTYDSTETVVGTRPGRPRNARGSSNGHNVTISWDVPEDVINTPQDADFGRARSYTVVAGSATGGSDIGTFDVGNVTSYSAALPPGTYYARIYARNYRGVSDPSDEVVVTSVADIPGAPGAPVVETSSSGATLSWTPPSTGGTVRSYSLVAGTTPGGQQLGIFNVATNARVARALPPGTYYVRVFATGSDGNGPMSAETAFTISTPPPGAPSAPMVTIDPSTNAVTLSWNAPASGGAPTEYSVIAGTAPGAANVGRFSTSLARTLTQVLAAGTYYVRVVATNTGGDGPLSEETSFTVVPPVPAAPGTPQVTVDGSAVTVTWTAPTTGAAPTSYTLIAGNTPAGNQLGTVTTGLTRSFSFTLSPGTYYIRVVASNGAGNGSASPEASFVVYGAPGAPGTPKVLVDDDSVTLSWSAPTTGGPVTRYVLVVGTTKGGSEFGTVDVGAQTNITVSDVPRDNYYVRVIAVNSMGQSPASEEISFRVR